MHYDRRLNIAILLVILCMSVMCACTSANVRQHKATAGMLDVSDIAAADFQTIKLDGEWEFYWSRLLAPADFDEGAEVVPEKSGYIDLPGSWLKFTGGNESVTDYGFATYRLVIKVREDTRWSMRVPVILTAYRLWVNGELVASAGKPGTSETDSVPGVNAPLVGFDSEDRRIELVLQVSNFDDLWGGVNTSFLFGASGFMQRDYEQDFFFNVFCFGAILIFALYHFGLFAFRSKDYSTLLFGAICSFITICMIVFDKGFATHFFPAFPWEFAKKVAYITMNFGGSVFLLFMNSLYPGEVPKRVLYASVAYGTCTSLFFIFFPFSVYVRGLVAYNVILTFTFLYIAFLLVKASLKKREGAVIILAGHFVLMLTVANDILYTFDLIHTGFVTHIGLFVFILAQGLAIALANARMATKVEVLSRELGSYSKELEIKVNERTRQLEEANRQKTNYFVNMAHETKTPLTLILNYLEKDIKKRGASDEILLVKQSFDKLKRDMVNLLDLEKLSKGLVFYNHEQALNVSDALSSKVLLFAEIAQKKSIGLEKEIEKGLACRIDHYAFDRIVNNLVDNALRYTKPGGTVKVLLKAEGERIRLTVEDNGIGISADQQQYIFTPYRQVSSEKRNVQGIGIGLTIVKKILDGLGSEIVLDSELNRGTRISVLLARCEAASEQDGQCIQWSKPIDYDNMAIASERNPEEGKPHVLVVDDNKDMLACLMNGLGDAYNVSGASSGREALSLLRHIEKPDVIVSDIMMDDIDGFGLFGALSKDESFKSIPFIFVTAKTEQDEKMKGLEGGAVDFIYKPFVVEELRLKLASLIRMQTMQKNSYRKEISEKINSILKDIQPEKNGNGSNSQLEQKIDKYPISPKEKKIVVLLLGGYEYKEISYKLGISINTLKPYINKIYRKLKIHSKVDLFNLIQDTKF